MKQPQLGKKILELRKEKGLTQEELVEICNINVRTIQRIESGDVTPRNYTLKNVLKALDYEFDEIKTELENVLKVSKIQLLILNLSFWIGILMIPVDSYSTFYELIAYFEINEFNKYSSKTLYLISTVVGIVCSVAFYLGFFVVGQVFKSTLLKVSSILLLGATFLSYVLTYESFNWGKDAYSLYAFIEMFTIGTIGIPFGIGILKLYKHLDQYAKFTGIFTIIVYGCLVTIILGFISIFFYFPVLVMQLILLYKAKETFIIREN